MAEVVDLFAFREEFGITPSFGPFSPTTTPINFLQAPGDVDTGSIIGGLIDIAKDIIGGRSPGLALPQVPGGALPPLPGGGRSGPGFTLGGPISPNGTGCTTDSCCKGFHLNKSQDCAGNPPGSKCVRNRRMNALNPRALRRAIRRAKGFERFVRSNRKSLKSLARI